MGNYLLMFCAGVFVTMFLSVLVLGLCIAAGSADEYLDDQTD